MYILILQKDSLYGLYQIILVMKILNQELKKIEKRNPADFALWKFGKTNDVSFEAPFGKGRPGWHMWVFCYDWKHLAYKDTPYQIDIHGGGADLLFHHENEAAQTRCSSGQN